MNAPVMKVTLGLIPVGLDSQDPSVFSTGFVSDPEEGVGCEL